MTLAFWDGHFVTMHLLNSNHLFLLIFLLLMVDLTKTLKKSCTFRLDSRFRDLSTPIKVKTVQSITSCASTCLMLRQCHFFGVSKTTCVMAEASDSNSQYGTLTVYQKVKI